MGMMIFQQFSGFTVVLYYSGLMMQKNIYSIVYSILYNLYELQLKFSLWLEAIWILELVPQSSKPHWYTAL